MLALPHRSTEETELHVILNSLDYTFHSKASLSLQVYELMQHMIVHLKLLPSTPISEQKIADALKVSRTPAREALRMLLNDGLIEVIPQSGTYISKISISKAREGQFLRRTIETANLLEFAAEIKPEHIAQLHEMLELQALTIKHRNFQRFFELDGQFHESFFRWMQREYSWELVLRAKVHSDRARRVAVENQGIPEEAHEWHTKIVSLLEERDLQSLAVAINSHLKTLDIDIFRVPEHQKGWFE